MADITNVSTHISDILRVLVVSGLGTLAGALIVVYIVGVYRDPLKTVQTPMFWGGLAALALLISAIVDQVSRIGTPPSWRLPTLAFSVIAGWVAIRLHIVQRRDGDL